MSHNSRLTHPLIGILCMDRKQTMAEDICSYIDNAYVEYLETAGAKVVPIWINQGSEYYSYILSRVNGVLLPGGAVFVNEHDPARLELTNHSVRAIEIIIGLAKEKYEAGIQLPIWGTCLGFQLLILYTTKLANTTYDTDPRDKCQFMNCILPVKFLPDFRASRLFAKLPPDLEEIMQNQRFGNHRHKYCWSIETCKRIDDDWHVLAKNSDGNGTDFASIMEHRKYPFYGTQFHPESVCPESEQYLEANEYLAKFFVNECRRCSNRFESIEEENRHMIKHFPTTIVEEGSKQSYVRAFDDSPNYPH